MTIADIRTEIIARIHAAADPAVAEKLARVVPGASVVGVPVPALRQMAVDVRQIHPELDLAGAADLMDILCRDQVREQLLVGIFVLGRFGRKLIQLPWRRLTPWLAALDNWETCDQLASNVAGVVVAADLALVDQLLALTSAENLWQRRFALATSVALNQKGRVHPAEAMRLCQPLLNDPEPMVRKAIGWALREASKHAEPQVFRFLMAHRGQMPSTVRREASRKLTPRHQAQILDQG